MKRLYIVLLLAASPGQAALIDRGSGLIYDDILNITWLQDANFAMTSGFDADGRMTWDEAMAWADGLSYYDATRDVTWNDWRLATEDVNDDNVAINCNAGNEILCRDAELGYMYFHNGVTADTPGIFSNVIGSVDLVGYAYWSQSESVPSSIVDIMQFSNGAQGFSGKDGDSYSWVVLDGDVGAIPPSMVPLPASSLLLLTGIFGITLIRKRAD